MWPNPQEIASAVTFTEENLNGKLHFMCIVCKQDYNSIKVERIYNKVGIPCYLWQVSKPVTLD